MINYGTKEQLKEQLLYKRIIKWAGDCFELEDGTIVTIEESEQDCCASAGGEFKDVKLDAVITDVEFGEPEVVEGDEDFGEFTMRNTVTIYHNQNPIAIADCEADAGNGGYYYSVCSLVIKNVHYKVVEA